MVSMGKQPESINVFSCSEMGIILPTYSESQNISRLIDALEGLNIDLTILVIDDSSPDGTAEIVRQKQKEYTNIMLLIRPAKLGLGTAITDGFRFFLSIPHKPKYIVTMDADFSHNPLELPRLLETISKAHCGIVIGSRYCKGGQIVGWPTTRKVISKTANFIAKTSLKLKMRDCTSGFRCYSTEFLLQSIDNLHSHTYEIQIETVRQATLRNFIVRETPIVFINRKHGKSKLTLTEIRSYLTYTLKAILN
jgi:dolichol-phosphate mannosyltransferase